jgi:hypothetical protein
MYLLEMSAPRQRPEPSEPASKVLLRIGTG